MPHKTREAIDAQQRATTKIVVHVCRTYEYEIDSILKGENANLTLQDLLDIAEEQALKEFDAEVGNIHTKDFVSAHAEFKT